MSAIEINDQQATKSGLGRSFGGRVIIVAIPAALITASLFLGMRAMIQVNDFTPPEVKTVILDPFMVPPETEEPKVNWVKPIPPSTVTPPPPMETIKIDKASVELEGGYTGVAPAVYEEPSVASVKPVSLAFTIDKTARPLTPPTPVYPVRAAEKGIEGSCDVSMDVSVTGKPYNVVATCTNSVFKASAERAVRKVLFSPRVKDGQRMELRGVIYPIEYNIGG